MTDQPQAQTKLLRFPKLEMAEIDNLAREWCKAKHIIVMLDPIAKQFAMDVANKAIREVMMDIIERAAAKKCAQATTQPGAATPQPPQERKSSLVLTDAD